MTLGLLLAGCSRQASAPQRGPVEVGVVTLATQPVTVSNELTGRTAATTASDVRPQVNGIIKARLFQEGSLVRAGQPLYEIDPRLYQATRDEAAAQLENAQATLATAQGGSATAFGSLYVQRNASGGFDVQIDTHAAAADGTGPAPASSNVAVGADGVQVDGIGQVTQIAGNGNRMANVEAVAWQGDRGKPIAAARINFLLERPA